MNYLNIVYSTLMLCILFPSTAQAKTELTVPRGIPPISLDSAAERKQKLRDIPGNTSFQEEEQWNNQRATTLKDITDYVPGVIAQPRNGAEAQRLSIRGSGLSSVFQGRGLLILQDDIPITMADGEFEFPVIDPWLIRNTEIYPGANALEIGASTFGGAINLVTPTGITGEGDEIRVEGGSFGTFHAKAASGRKWGKHDAFIAATGFVQDGFRDQNQQETGRLNANWGWQGSEQFINRVYINHTQSDAELPGALSKAALHRDLTQANAANRNGNYQRNLNITRIANRSAWREGANRIDSTVYYTYRNLDNPVTTYEFQDNHDMGVRLKYEHDAGTTQLSGGINAAYGNADEIRYRNRQGRIGSTIVSRELDALTSEVYGQVEQELGDSLYGIAGAQGSYATREINENFPTSEAQKTDYAGFSPRIGLRYDFTTQNQLFANLSQSFEPPTWGELSGGNSPGFSKLDAQRATTAEIGMRGTYEKLNWQAAYYHGWLKDEFVNYRFADGSSDTINADRTQRDGIELGVNGDAVQNIWKSGDAIALRTAYTYSRFRLDDDPLYGGNQLPGVPEHYLRSELLYRHPSGISIGPNVEWSPSDMPVDLTNTFYADAYTLYGLRAAWEDAQQGWNVYIEGRNLSDERYSATTNVIPDAAGKDGRYFYPGEGRAIYAGLRIKL